MSIAAARALTAYRRKRDFANTAEPSGDAALPAPGRRYVMHKHAASHLHFDLRLEEDGVLRSWALPKGPSMKRGERRLAIEVEDPPIAYGGVLRARLQGTLRERAAAPAGAGKPAADLTSRSKAQLYALAQSMDVPGRSGMSKARLIEALTSRPD